VGTFPAFSKNSFSHTASFSQPVALLPWYVFEDSMDVFEDSMAKEEARK
jgi:hypothetical protein